MNPLLAAVLAASLSAPAPRLVLHEWGTFTSVAGADGAPIVWRPLAAPSDLPSFVYTLEKDGRRFRPRGKSMMSGTVRMETPVIYFYADEDVDVSLKVDFPGGAITEWYPFARSTYGGIDWGKFQVRPTVPYTDVPASNVDLTKLALPQRAVLKTEPAPSHYYPARAVDAAIVQVCGQDRTEHEKFLFYRGVGTFALPLKAKQSGSALAFSGFTGTVLLFERSGARAGVRVLDVKGDATAERPALTGRVEDAHRAVLDVLRGTGLYDKEARAMLETWKDTWFEDGLRALYVLSAATTDALLPLTVSPKPTESVRVLVGRLELLLPDRVTALRTALAKGQEAAAQKEYGRFAEPLLTRAIVEAKDVGEQRRLAEVLSRWSSNGATAQALAE